MYFPTLIQNGYTVVPNFLSEEEVTLLKNDYANNSNRLEHYGNMKMVSKNAIDIISSKIINTLTDIRNSTSIKADTILYPQLYVDNINGSFDWHQDHEAWYIEQETVNHLNFYIPLHKEFRNKSGISIIPMQLLKLHPLLINRGARRFTPGPGPRTEVIDDDLGQYFYLNFDISKHAVTPEIGPGDLLILRGDLIHKTQDTDTERYSLSVRCSYGGKIISKSRLFSGCEMKMRFLENNSKLYKAITDAFGDQEYIELSKVLNKELLYEVE